MSTGQPTASAQAGDPASEGAADEGAVGAEGATDMEGVDGTLGAAVETEVDPQSLRNIIHELISERDELSSERDSHLDLLLRTKAEFENFRKKAREREQRASEQATANLLEKLIPILDGLEAAGFSMAPISASDADLEGATNGISSTEPEHTGLALIAKLFFDALSEAGLVALHPFGEPFDPNLSEAVEHIPAEDADLSPEEQTPGDQTADASEPQNSQVSTQVVIGVFRTGYQWNDKLLRPAIVKVQG